MTRSNARDKIFGGAFLAFVAAAASAGACGGSTVGGAGPDASSPLAEAGGGGSADSGACFIVASNYDQSCTADSDCVTLAGNVLVGFGDYCHSRCLCGGGAINKSAAPRFAADVARTPLGSGAIPGVACGCPEIPSTGCCQSGSCMEFCSAACSVASPCQAGTSGCPGSGLPIPAQGDPCSPPGTSCYGYGSLSCPQTLTCSAAGKWQVSCPVHPFGTDSGSCGCSVGP